MLRPHFEQLSMWSGPEQTRTWVSQGAWTLQWRGSQQRGCRVSERTQGGVQGVREETGWGACSSLWKLVLPLGPVAEAGKGGVSQSTGTSPALMASRVSSP